MGYWLAMAGLGIMLMLAPHLLRPYVGGTNALMLSGFFYFIGLGAIAIARFLTNQKEEE